MKKLLLFLLLIAFTGCKNKTEEHVHDSPVQQTSQKSLSPLTSSMISMGDAHIHISYSSPSVRKRIIFGGLLAFGEVWQAGAHKATWIESNKDLRINDQVVAAGKYGIFMIPDKEEWTIILNTRWDQHGKDEYNPAEDVVRVVVKPTHPSDFTESLTYEIHKRNESSGSISMKWEEYKVEFPFETID